MVLHNGIFSFSLLCLWVVASQQLVSAGELSTRGTSRTDLMMIKYICSKKQCYERSGSWGFVYTQLRPASSIGTSCIKSDSQKVLDMSKRDNSAGKDTSNIQSLHESSRIQISLSFLSTQQFSWADVEFPRGDNKLGTSPLHSSFLGGRWPTTSKFCHNEQRACEYHVWLYVSMCMPGCMRTCIFEGLDVYV